MDLHQHALAMSTVKLNVKDLLPFFVQAMLACDIGKGGSEIGLENGILTS
jgi:hypothetical protein